MNKVSKQEPTALPAEYMEEMTQDTDVGGKYSSRDISIPYLVILQAKSPQVDVENAKRLPGADATMIYLSVYDDLYTREQGIRLIPCYYERVINEWVPRERGGGLARTWSVESALPKTTPDERGRLFMANGNQLVETAYRYCLAERPSGVWVPAIFPMASSALRANRNWNSLILTSVIPGTTKKAPDFGYIYLLKTQRVQRDTNVWSGPVITPTGKLVMDLSVELYREAKRFAQQAATGGLRRPIEEQHQQDDSTPASEVI